jgi:hypothetical protein
MVAPPRARSRSGNRAGLRPRSRRHEAGWPLALPDTPSGDHAHRRAGGASPKRGPAGASAVRGRSARPGVACPPSTPGPEGSGASSRVVRPLACHSSLFTSGGAAAEAAAHRRLPDRSRPRRRSSPTGRDLGLLLRARCEPPTEAGVLLGDWVPFSLATRWAEALWTIRREENATRLESSPPSGPCSPRESVASSRRFRPSWGPDALLGFQPLQGFPLRHLGPMPPPVLLSQAWPGPGLPKDARSLWKHLRRGASCCLTESQRATELAGLSREPTDPHEVRSLVVSRRNTKSRGPLAHGFASGPGVHRCPLTDPLRGPRCRRPSRLPLPGSGSFLPELAG